MPMLMQPNAALFSTGDAFGFSLLGMFGAPLTSTTATTGATDAASAFSALFAQMTQNLGQPVAPAVEVIAKSEGLDIDKDEDFTDAALASIQQTIQIVYNEISRVSEGGIDLGSIGSAKELAFAYRQMGMEPEEAARRAIQLTTIMAILDQRLQSGAEMNAAVVDPSLLLQVQDMMTADETMRTTALSTRSLSVFAGIALTASIDGNLANRILKGENLSQDLGSIVSRTIQALGVPLQDEAALAEMVDDGTFDQLLQQAAPANNRTDLVAALQQLNAQSDAPLSADEIAEIAAVAQRLVADARNGAAHKIDADFVAKLAEVEPDPALVAKAAEMAKPAVAEGVVPPPAVAEGLAQSAARAADSAQRIRTEITATIEKEPVVDDAIIQSSPKAGSSAERAATPPPRIPPCGTRRQ